MLTYTDRAQLFLSPLAKRLLQLMDEKKTNLALAADVTSAQQLLSFANLLGPEICVLKTHIDILNDFTQTVTQELRKLANQHHFLLFEDRKFADIGNTVKQQYEGGIYHIVDWADIVNAHSFPGPGTVKGLAQAGRKKKNRALLLIAQMSAEGQLIDSAYTHQTLTIAQQFGDFTIGFITQDALSTDPNWINFTPGKFSLFTC